MTIPVENNVPPQPVTYACAPAPYPPPPKDEGRLGSIDDGTSAFVMTTLDKIWKMGYVHKAFVANDDVMALSKKGGTTVISYCFIDPQPVAQRSEKEVAVEKGMKVWEEHANVSFVKHPAESPESAADIRISFCTPSGSSWSAVGATRRNGGDGSDLIPPDKPTINFGVLSDGESLNEEATILHELGHVLGMMHEHQSPARGVKITLKTEEVYRYYRPLLGFNDNLVKSQIINEYKRGESNFSHFDPKSIMMYFMPAHLNVENIEIRPNTKLSEFDKAYIQLAYPKNDSGRLLSAMGTIGVPESDALRIIEPILICATSDKVKIAEWWEKNREPEDGEKQLELKHILRRVRIAFFDYNKRNIEAQALLKAKKKMAGIQEPLKELATEGKSVDDSSAKPARTLLGCYLKNEPLRVCPLPQPFYVTILDA